MKLIIAEKPSVAGEIAKVVGANTSCKGYKEGNSYIVSWCVGHLIELAMPEKYGEQYKDWNIDSLPIIPQEFKTEISAPTSEQYKVLKELMQRSDVDEIIEATDAGREGELIFRLVYEKAGCKKPFKRLWISSLEEKSIKDGLENMKEGSEYDNLYAAAVCRQRADWLYGINLTRLYSTLYKSKLTCGRVQTPTINMIVDRKQQIDSFVPQPYWVLHAEFPGFTAKKRIDEKAAAQELAAKLPGAKAIIKSVVTENKKEMPPALYDLTTLQRDANRLFGFSAQQTLDAMQSLYEARLTTYPRTDSRYLTEDMEESTVNLLRNVMAQNIVNTSEYDIEKTTVERLINNSKVSDHHAIIPTSELTLEKFHGLPTVEKNVLSLVIARLLTAAYMPYEYTVTKATIDICGADFEASGKVITNKGYKTYELTVKNKGDEDKDTELPALSEVDEYTVKSVTSEEKKTKAPDAFTEDTLLSAMETAGKTISDDELKDAIKDGGLGTPATRAGIIENIIASGYIARDGKKLMPTEKALKFMPLVYEKLKKPELTAEWEFQLAKMQRGEFSEKAFMAGITSFLSGFIETIKATKDDAEKDIFREPKKEKEVFGTCPKCGSNVVAITAKDGKRYYVCDAGKEKCGFIISETVAGKKVKETDIKTLLSGKETKIIKGFKSKAGKDFEAKLILKFDGSIGFIFDSEVKK